MLFLLPVNQTPHLSLYSVDWPKLYAAFQTLIHPPICPFICLSITAITVMSYIHVHKNMCNPEAEKAKRRHWFCPQMFQFPLVIANPIPGLNFSPSMIYTHRRIYIYRGQTQSIWLRDQKNQGSNPGIAFYYSLCISYLTILILSSSVLWNRSINIYLIEILQKLIEITYIKYLAVPGT